jgi:hypothetical protein
MSFWKDFEEGFLWGPRQIGKGVGWLNDSLGQARSELKKIPLVGGLVSEAVEGLTTPVGALGDVADGIGLASTAIDTAVERLENLTPEQRRRVAERLERERRVEFKAGRTAQRTREMGEGLAAFQAAGGAEGKVRRREARRAELLSQARAQGYNTIGEMGAAREVENAIQRSINADRSTALERRRRAGLR